MDRLCDELGIDTVSAGVSIAFAMECFEEGILKDDEVDNLKLQFGNEEAAIECLRKIAYRDGIGDLLAEGTARMARKIGKGAEKFAINVKGLEIPGHSPRGLQGMMLGYATSTRGGSHHDSRPTTEYGVVDRTTTDGKAHLTMSIQHMTAVGDSLVLCRFTERVYGFTLEWNMEHDAQPEVLRTAYVDMVNLVTGMNLSLKELVKIGERIYNLERYVNTRMGMRRSHDTLPRRIMEEPIPDGPSKGMVASKEKLNKLLDEYYSLRGWDENGIPTPEKLKELGLIKEAEVVKTLE
jgi:aldehyde:ferredoxin oxidoreductase